MKFTILTIFKCTYSSVTLNIITLLCNQFPELFTLQNWNSVPIKNQFPICSSHNPWQPPFYHLPLNLIALMGGIMQYLSFCDWLISLSIMSSRFLHVVAGVIVSWLFKAEQYSIVYIDHILFIYYPSVDTLVASASWQLRIVLQCTWVCTYLLETLLSILLDGYPEVELLDHRLILFLI